jgi:putative endonuclease
MKGYTYIMTNKYNSVLYTGVTSDLRQRVTDHKEKKHPGSFTARYNIYKLVYYELFHTIEEAIERERQLKAGSRKKKEQLINGFNPEWKDLFDEIKYW